ncbi:MAG: PaaI family thioesterase [Granulicella sp.]
MPTPDEASHLPIPLDAPTDATLDERSNHCFGCSPNNPQGLHLHFTIDAEALTATAPVCLTRLHEGPPGHIHGGIIAVLMDEAMSKLNRPLNAVAMTRNMQIDYLRPSPLEQILTLSSRHLRREGRKLFHYAELTDAAGNVLAKATGLFIVIDPSVIERHLNR